MRDISSGKAPFARCLKAGNLVVHLVDVRGKAFRLLLEERRRLLRLPLPALQILPQEQAGQLVRHLLRQDGLFALVRDGKRDGGLHLGVRALVHHVGADHATLRYRW